MLYGKHWDINGVIAGSIHRGSLNGEYQVIFEYENASLEEIRGIDWSRPIIQRLKGTPAGAFCLPEGYGFDVVGIDYHHGTESFTVRLNTASQFLGDVTEYQERIRTLEEIGEDRLAVITEQENTITQQRSVLDQQLAEISEKAAELTQKIEELALRASEIAALQEQLAESDELAIELYEAQLKADREEEIKE